MTLGAIVIGNPALWGGLLAVGIPLAIHLLTRKSRRHLRFPSLRFIRKARASQSSLFKVRHLLLMILRTLAVLLLVIAFLKPILLSGALTGPQDRSLPSAVVVILDASASMQYRSAGATVFSRAKIAAEKILDDLGRKDLSNVILAGLQPRSSFNEPTGNRFHLRQDVSQAKATRERADVDAALAEAVAQLKDLKGFRKELYLVSDFQRSNWAAAQLGGIPKGIKTVFVPVGDETSSNASVEEVVLQPPVPTIGEEVEITCRVAYDGAGPADIPLELIAEGEVLLKREIHLEPGTSVSETFTIKTRKTGFMEGTVVLPEDRLEVDNRRYFTLPVGDQIRVLVVSDEPRRDSATSHHTMMTAINPYHETDKAPIVCDLVNSADLRPLDLKNEQLVVLTGVNQLRAEALEHLISYLRQGGSVIFFLASLTDSTNLLNLGAYPGGDLELPFLPGNPLQFNADEDESPATLAQANFEHPILRKFKETGDLGDVRFMRYFDTDRSNKAGQVLLRYGNRKVAMALQAVGAGSILVCNFSPAQGYSDLSKRTIFVPFMHEMIRALRPRRDQGERFVIGAPCSTTVKRSGAEAALRFVEPGGESVSAIFEHRENETAVIFPETPREGFYRVYAGPVHAGSVGVNVDKREGRLNLLASEQLNSLADGSPGTLLPVSSASMADVGKLRSGRPVWHWFLLAALIILAVEQCLWLVWRY